MKGKTMHDKIINKYTKAVDYIKAPKDMTGRVFRKAIKQTNINNAVKFLTSQKAIRYYKENGKVPTLRTLGKMALNFELGMPVDDDSLVNETERPAY